jgi:hypothetical protein
MNSTVSHESRRPEATLQELKGVIAESQSALLEGHPEELENCILRQKAHCKELEFWLREYGTTVAGDVEANSAPTRLVVTAMEAREQNRLFSALLRRMRHNLEVMRNILSGPSDEYSARQSAAGAPKT